MDGSEDDLLYESENEAKVNWPEPECGICDKSRDVFEKLLETDSNDGGEFDRVLDMHIKQV